MKIVSTQTINDVQVTAVEQPSEDGLLITHEGLVEAMSQPYKGMTPEQILEASVRRYQRILSENSELVAQFVN